MKMKHCTIGLAALGGTAVALWQLLSSGGPFLPNLGVSIGVGLALALLASLLFPLARRFFGAPALPVAAPPAEDSGSSGNARRNARRNRRAGKRSACAVQNPGK